MSKQDRVRRLTQAHKAEQVRLAQATGVAEMGLVEQLAEGALSVQEFRLQAVAVNRVGHDSAASLAGNYVRQTRGVWLPEQVDLPVVTPVFDTAQSLARAESTVRAVDKAVSDASRVVKSVEQIAGVFRQWTASNVANAHRRTIIDSAEAAGSGWRVVTDGHPCAFCAMLASYGEDINGAWAWPNHYFHHDCGCTIQEVPFGVDVEFTAREREFVRLRELADEQADLFPGALKRQRLIAAMRANGQGVVNDALVPDDLRKSSKRKNKDTVKKNNDTVTRDDLLMRDLKRLRSVKSHQVAVLEKPLSSAEIVSKVGGLDKTKGSCASLALAYAGNVSGYDVTDFRGGASRSFFAKSSNLYRVSTIKGVKSWKVSTSSELNGTLEIMQHASVGKEYILGAGQHAAVIKRVDHDKFQYLELQGSKQVNGWRDLTKDRLMSRFGVVESWEIDGRKRKSLITLTDIESLGKSEYFKELLSYINTPR